MLILPTLGEHHGIARFFRARNRETSKIVSPLLKVVSRLVLGLKMTAIYKFILALITNLSSKTFHFRVICEKLNRNWQTNRNWFFSNKSKMEGFRA